MAAEESHPVSSENSGGVKTHSSVSSQQLLVEAANRQLRNGGMALFVQQFWAMVVKKWTYVARNWLLLLTQVLIPILFLVITLVLLRYIPGRWHCVTKKWATQQKSIVESSAEMYRWCVGRNWGRQAVNYGFGWLQIDHHGHGENMQGRSVVSQFNGELQAAIQ